MSEDSTTARHTSNTSIRTAPPSKRKRKQVNPKGSILLTLYLIMVQSIVYLMHSSTASGQRQARSQGNRHTSICYSSQTTNTHMTKH